MSISNHTKTSAPASPPASAGFQRLLAGNFEFLTSPRNFYMLVSAVFVALYALRVLPFPATGGDDAEQILFSQVFAWGYDIRNPPLYTWLLIGAQSLLGISVATVELLKFLLLWATYILLYHVARQLLADRRLAALAALSPFGLYYVAWDALLGYSHSVLLLAVSVATYLALLRLDRRGDTASYLLLGVLVAVGMLSKYGYGLFFLALLGAALLDPALRHRLFDWRSLLALAVATALLAPHGLWAIDWMASNPGLLDRQLVEKMGVQADAGLLARIGTGTMVTVKAILSFMLPLLIFLVALFPRAFRRVPGSHTERNRHRRLLGRFLVLLIGGILVVVVISGTTRLRIHYMFILTLAPTYFFARVEAAGIGIRAQQRFAAVLSGLILIILIALPAKYLIDPWRCSQCDLLVPYEKLARQLREAGFRRGTILAYYYPHVLAGNLKVYFPDSRVVSAKHPRFIPPARENPEPCLVIWDVGYYTSIAGMARRRLGLIPKGDEPLRYVEAPIPFNPNKKIRLEFRLYDSPGVGCY